MRRRLGASKLSAIRWAHVAVLGALVSGCGRGALDGQSPQADRIAFLWWLLFGIACAVFVVLMALLGYALFRNRPNVSRFEREPGSINSFIVIGGAVIPLMILAVVFGFTIATMAASSADGGGDGQMEVDVIGHDFWWEVRYPQQQVASNNEIHVPVGRDVEFKLQSEDVIHSFWVPQLNGKTDMIPGQTNSTVIRATTPGRYAGKCAEFCGIGHACMTFVIVVETQEQFDAWLATQPGAAARQSNPQTFNDGECVGPQARGPGPAGAALAYAGRRS